MKRMRAGDARIAAIIAAVALVAGAALAGCAAPAGDPVVTIRVVDEEYRVELNRPDLVEVAEQLLAGELPPMIPNGRIVYGDPGPNAPWSWHIDPDSFEWADFTTEVCDGLPSFVERHEVTSEWYCPWDATVISIER